MGDGKRGNTLEERGRQRSLLGPGLLPVLSDDVLVYGL